MQNNPLIAKFTTWLYYAWLSINAVLIFVLATQIINNEARHFEGIIEMIFTKGFFNFLVLFDVSIIIALVYRNFKKIGTRLDYWMMVCLLVKATFIGTIIFIMFINASVLSGGAWL